MFCAKAGAKKVIAIDNSDVIAQAREIIKLNNYDDVITCVKGKAEALIGNNELPLDDGETVDVIVSGRANRECYLHFNLRQRLLYLTPAT